MKKILALFTALCLLALSACAGAEVLPGSVLSFGRYAQETPNQEMVWRVLYVDQYNVATLLNLRVLDCMPFDSYSNNWASSSLCRWLNKNFLSTAFSAQEMMCLRQGPDGFLVTIPTKGDMISPAYGFDTNPDTKDYSRTAYGTPHAISNGLWTNKKGECTFFLRSTPNKTNVEQIRTNGSVGVARVDRDNIGIRPMIYLDLDQYARYFQYIP